MANRTCSIEGCDRPHCGRGWCSMHHQRWRKHGHPLGKPRPLICQVEGCGKSPYARGWCRAHYARWQRNGDPGGGRRAYSFDETFFDVIDTEAKAYWLGFITADGCVVLGRDAGGWAIRRMSVKLQASDSGHLEKLKSDMKADNPVRPVPAVTTGHPQAEFTLSSAHLVESLIRLGVTPRKSLTATPWDGPGNLMRHYWRGMVDGDGTIIRHPGEREKWHVRLLGSEACIEAFRLWGAAVCGSAADKYPKGRIWTWTAGGLASPQALVRALYDGSTVYLDRKYELALQLMAAPVRHRSWLRPDIRS